MENGAPHLESIDAQTSGVNLPLSSSTTRGTCRCLSAFRLNCKRLNHTVRRSRSEYFWFGEAGIRGDPRANEGLAAQRERDYRHAGGKRRFQRSPDGKGSVVRPRRFTLR